MFDLPTLDDRGLSVDRGPLLGESNENGSTTHAKVRERPDTEFGSAPGYDAAVSRNSGPIEPMISA
jgi:hypothetical protein